MAGVNKIFARIAKREGPDLSLPCLSRLFWQATSVRNLRIFTICPVGLGLFDRQTGN